MEIRSIRLEHIYKYFDNNAVVSDVSFQLDSGNVYSIVGENGAGKSTIVKIMNGTYIPDQGKIYVNDQEVKFTSPSDANKSAIGMVYQELHLIPNLSITENIFAFHLTDNKLGIVNWKQLEARAAEYLKLFNLRIDPRTLVGNLKVAHQQIVAIIRAYAMNNRLLILDEPTSALPTKDIHIVLDVVRQLVKLGCIIVYISHKLDEVLEISDRIIAMRNGVMIGEFAAKDVTKSKLTELIAGKTIENKFPKQKFERGAEIIRFENVSVPNCLQNISFSLHQGEILGFSGLLGAGKTEIAKTLFGVFGRAYSGAIYYKGKKLDTASPKSVISRKIGLVPEDRSHEGLILEHSVSINIALASLSKQSRFGVLSGAKAERRIQELIKELHIKCGDVSSRARQLSGGNQQKVVLAKWIMAGCDFVIFDEPTRGIDVGAKHEIYNLMNKLVEQGVGVMIMSSEFDEVLGMADRTILLKDGQMVGEFDSETTTEDDLLAMC